MPGKGSAALDEAADVGSVGSERTLGTTLLLEAGVVIPPTALPDRENRLTRPGNGVGFSDLLGSLPDINEEDFWWASLDSHCPLNPNLPRSHGHCRKSSHAAVSEAQLPKG